MLKDASEAFFARVGEVSQYSNRNNHVNRNNHGVATAMVFKDITWDSELLDGNYLHVRIII